MRSRVLRGLLLAAGLTLTAAACGDSDTSSAPANTGGGSTNQPQPDHDHDAEHDHSRVVEIADGDAVPTLAVEVLKDPKSGWNLRVDVTDFDFAPERVSTDHVPGEGHAHVYVDGEKISRIYDRWFHLGELAPGKHEVRVELSANDHSPLAVDGSKIEQTVAVEVPEASGGGHDHGVTDSVEAVEPLPSVEIELIADPAGGWTLHAQPQNFTLAPEHVSTEHVDGEGHMHLFIDGVKVTRLLSEWHQLPSLGEGGHEIRVELSANDHAVVVIDGVPVEATATVTVEPGSAGGGAQHDDGQHDHEHDHDHGSTGEPTRFDAELTEATQTIDIEVADGSPVGGVTTVSVEAGSVVAVMVTADGDDVVHVHGFDILRPVSPDAPAHFAFRAEIPGVFEVELENSGRLLVELEIS